MEEVFKCISIDDDPLFVRKIESFLEDITWIELVEKFNNPIKGATGVVSHKPDLVLLDVEMPYMQGDYLVDWLKPSLEQMETPPKIIVMSSLDNPPQEMLDYTDGFINKKYCSSKEEFEKRLTKILKPVS